MWNFIKSTSLISGALVLSSTAIGKSFHEKQLESNNRASKKIERILACEPNEMPSTLVPLIYQLNGHNTFNRRDSYTGEYTLLPQSLFLYNQPVDSIYVTKLTDEQNKDYYQYNAYFANSVNPSILAQHAGFTHDSWTGRYIKQGNQKVQINFQNGQTMVSCLQPILFS